MSPKILRSCPKCRPEFYHMLNNILSSLLHNYPHHHLKNEICYKHFWFIFTSLCSTSDKISGDIAQHFGREDLRATWPVTISDILYYRCFFALNTDCWNGLLCWPQRGKTTFKFLTFFLAEKNLRVNKIFITLGGDSGNESENRSENYRQEA